FRSKRKLANDAYQYFDSVYFPVLYADTLKLVITNYSEDDNFGDNEFELTLDYTNQSEELDEMNNVATLNFFIPLGGTTNLFPHNFAIVPQNNPELIVQSNNVLDASRTYLFQIDTSSFFNSPAFKQQSISASAMATWKPTLIESSAGDSIVYFWRTKFADPKPGEDSTWTHSSFVYIQNSPEGWAQSHYYQYKNNERNGLKFNDSRRRVDFEENVTPVDVTVYGANHPTKGYIDTEVFLNN